MTLRSHIQALVLYVVVGLGGLYLIYAYNVFADEPGDTVAELKVELDEALLYGSVMTALLMAYALRLYWARQAEHRRQADAIRSAREAGDTDPLTHLPNRRVFDLLVQERRQAVTNDALDAIFLLDLNRFKHVNDTFGHAAGDELLCTLAARIAAQVRSGDTVARIGGDEFAIFAPGVSDSEASAIAKRIISAVAEPVAGRHGTYEVGTSIGIALVPAGSADPSDLAAADEAMYRAKRSGRSTFRFSDARAIAA